MLLKSLILLLALQLGLQAVAQIIQASARLRERRA